MGGGWVLLRLGARVGMCWDAKTRETWQAQLGSCSRQSPCVQGCVVLASQNFGALTCPAGIPPCLAAVQAAGKRWLWVLRCWGLWLARERGARR